MFNQVRATPKTTHKRFKPTRKQRNEFTPKIRKQILERDNDQCVRCGRKAEHIHHIIFRSALGGNDATNGVSVCHICHAYAHSSREGREWFEKYREMHLIGGNRDE